MIIQKNNTSINLTLDEFHELINNDELGLVIELLEEMEMDSENGEIQLEMAYSFQDIINRYFTGGEQE